MRKLLKLKKFLIKLSKYMSGLMKVHVVVEGRVQGVGFRYFAEREALRLGIKGWVRNTYEGTVELKACGSVEKIEVFLNYIRKGPPMAVVNNLKILEQTEVSKCEYDDFFIRF